MNILQIPYHETTQNEPFRDMVPYYAKMYNDINLTTIKMIGDINYMKKKLLFTLAAVLTITLFPLTPNNTNEATISKSASIEGDTAETTYQMIASDQKSRHGF